MSGSALLAVVLRPGLWAEALRAAWALRSRRGWRRWGLAPDRAYLRWRVATAYGEADRAVAAADLVAYLSWRRRQRAAVRRGN